MVVDILGFFRGRRKLQQDLPEEPVAATSVPSLPPRPQPPAAVISPLAPRRLDPAPHAKVPASATSSSAASSSDDSDKESEATTETGTMSKLDALLRDYGLDPYGDMLKDLGYNTPRKARRITHGGKREREREGQRTRSSTARAGLCSRLGARAFSGACIIIGVVVSHRIKTTNETFSLHRWRR